MRRFGFAGLALSLAILGASPADVSAQGSGAGDVDPVMQAWVEAMTPGPQHAVLASSQGSWAVTTTFWMMPGAEPQVSQGSAERRMIFGGRIMEETFVGDMAGQPMNGRATVGYDNVTGRYWSTWVDDMSTGITLMYGDYNDADDTWVMEGETPDPFTGGMIPMRIESRRDGENRQISEFYMPDPDGEMFRSMEMVYERR